MTCMNLSEYYVLNIIDFILLSQNMTLCLSPKRINITFSITELDPNFFLRHTTAPLGRLGAQMNTSLPDSASFLNSFISRFLGV